MTASWLQHRWTGGIHNVTVDVKQGSYISAVGYDDIVVKLPPSSVKLGQKVRKSFVGVRRCRDPNTGNNLKRRYWKAIQLQHTR